MKTGASTLFVSLLAASTAAYAAPASGIPNLTDIVVDGGGNVTHNGYIDYDYRSDRNVAYAVRCVRSRQCPES